MYNTYSQDVYDAHSMKIVFYFVDVRYIKWQFFKLPIASFYYKNAFPQLSTPLHNDIIIRSLIYKMYTLLQIPLQITHTYSYIDCLLPVSVRPTAFTKFLLLLSPSYDQVRIFVVMKLWTGRTPSRLSPLCLLLTAVQCLLAQTLCCVSQTRANLACRYCSVLFHQYMLFYNPFSDLFFFFIQLYIVQAGFLSCSAYDYQ